MRAALALAIVLVVTSAAAEPDYLGQLQRWLYPPKPAAHAPISRPSPVEHESPVTHQPIAVAEPPKVQPKPSSPRAKPAAKHRPAAPSISCSDARQGVGLPCFIIRQNAWRYENLSPEQRRQADNCLTASERAAIKACFH